MFSPELLQEPLPVIIQHAHYLESVNRLKVTRITFSSGYLVSVLKMNWLLLGSTEYDELCVIRRHPPLPYSKSQRDEALEYLVSHGVDVHEALLFIDEHLPHYHRVGRFDRNCKRLNLHEMLDQLVDRFR